MRACLVATEIARRARLDDADRRDVYYAALMRFAGCAATSHELAATLGGDDVAVRAQGDLIDASRPAEAMRFLYGIGGLRTLARAPVVPRLIAAGARADCEVGAQITTRLQLPEPVRRAVLDAFERFDGRGAPEGRAGEEIAPAARFAAVGYAAVMFDALGGAPLAAETVGRWSGRALDPTIAAGFLDAFGGLLAIASPGGLWGPAVEAEPGPRRGLSHGPGPRRSRPSRRRGGPFTTTRRSTRRSGASATRPTSSPRGSMATHAESPGWPGRRAPTSRAPTRRSPTAPACCTTSGASRCRPAS